MQQPYGYTNYQRSRGSVPPDQSTMAAHEMGETPAFESREDDEGNEEQDMAGGDTLRAIILQMLQRQAQGGR